MIDAALWWTGLATWFAVVCAITYVATSLVTHAVEVTVFTVRVWRRTKKAGAHPKFWRAARFWVESFWMPCDHITGEGIGIVYWPGKEPAR